MKKKHQVKIMSKPAFYATIFNSMKIAALDLGYALTIHGSLADDMDLIAVAWVKNAKPAKKLVASINNCLGDTLWKKHNFESMEEKPHGRICYTLTIDSDWYIDLSIIPPKDTIQ